MKNIVIITAKYPTKFNPTSLVFVQQLVWSFADMGIKCTVICPVPINIDIKQGLSLPYKTVETTKKGSKVTIIFPRYIGFGQQNLKFFNTSNLTLIGFSRAVRKVISMLNVKPDVIYGHFISPSGVTAARMGKHFGIPSFVAYGESTPWSIENIGFEKVRDELKTITGVVSVSTKNKNDLINLNVVEEEKIKVFPNAIRPEHFFPRNKTHARQKLGIPQNGFVIAFVGHFIKRKGIDKVISSINKLEGVYAIFAGKGPISPEGENTLYSGLVSPSDLPWFYSAADIFVLPTKNEGCCNAIIEAMACGLPIISSDKEFNYDILDNESSILINPESVDELIRGICKLRDDVYYRNYLRDKSLEKAKTLNYEQRANNIVNWIDSKLNKIN